MIDSLNYSSEVSRAEVNSVIHETHLTMMFTKTSQKCY